MIAAILIVLAVGTASLSDDFSYGPGDWLADNTSLAVTGGAHYEHLVEPVITVHAEDDLTDRCGAMANGCAIGNVTECHIYVGERASPGTVAHETRHCHGWGHGARIGGHYQWYPKSSLASN